MFCFRGTSVMPVSLSASGYTSARWRPSASISAFACLKVTLGLSRPTASIMPVRRSRKGGSSHLPNGNFPLLAKRLPPAVTEIFRDHAHHGVHRAVQRESLAHGSGRRSESAFPQSAANQHDRTRSQLVLLGKEHAADGRFHTQQREEARRHHLPRNTLGFSCSSQVKVNAQKGG